jgi:hypothetical protein
MKNRYLIIGATILFVAILLSLVRNPIEPVMKEQIINVDPNNLSGIQTGDAPWPVEIDHLGNRLSALGLPALQKEGTVLHIHQHLNIFIDGKNVSVPAGIGINTDAMFISPIHTHENDAIIHVESPTAQEFTLGQFFDIWGVRFTDKCIGGYCNQGDKTLRVFLNGNLFSGDPRKLVLQQHQEIVVTYGTPEDLINPIPSTYVFPPDD